MSSTSRMVLLSPIRHWVATTERAPAARSGVVSPCTPSPATLTPPAVRQAESTTRSARSRSPARSAGETKPSSPAPGESASAVPASVVSFTSACVARWIT
jgi:hypothetical protein